MCGDSVWVVPSATVLQWSLGRASGRTPPGLWWTRPASLPGGAGTLPLSLALYQRSKVSSRGHMTVLPWNVDALL